MKLWAKTDGEFNKVVIEIARTRHNNVVPCMPRKPISLFGEREKKETT